MQNPNPKLVPVLEVERKILAHYNRGDSIKGVDDAGYFIFQDVKVCEKGRAQEILDKDARSMETILFGGTI